MIYDIYESTSIKIGHMSTLIGATWSVTNLWFWTCLMSKIILMLQVFNVFTLQGF
jgi:hypothetical protein